jgi:hypothetical protein
MRRALLALALTTSSMWAQSVISAHSGVIHLTEGTVELDGKVIQSPAKLGEFVDMKTGQTLATKDGDAEVLLTPGVFLRLAENSSVKMISNKLDDTRIEVLAGSAMVQVGELLLGNAITLVYRNADISLAKRGLYRIDSDPARLRVFDGEAQVSSGDLTPVTVRKGHQVSINGETLEAKNFDSKETDAFYRWNARRDEYIAEANVYAAKTARDSGQGMGFYTGSGYGAGTYGGAGTWAFNPWFGMYTYLPYSGMFYSPFGYGYFSPFMVGYMYMPGSPFFLGSGLGRGVGTTMAGITTRNSTLGTGTGITRAGAVGATGFRGANGPATASSTRGGFFGGGGGGSTGGGTSSGGGLSSGGHAGGMGGGASSGGHGGSGGGGAHH